MNYTNMTAPLDLYTIFVSNFSGSITIFFFVAMAFFAYLASRFRMPNFIILMMVGVFVIFMAAFGLQNLFIVIILIAGLLFYFILQKLIK